MTYAEARFNNSLQPRTATSTLTQLLNYEVPESDARSGIGSCGGSGVTRLSAYACARASSVT